MQIARHLCGVHVAYTERGGVFDRELCTGQSTGRPQGSLYSYKKKRIANAVAFLQSKSRPECKPLIFVATSPGFTDAANEPRFLKKFIDNLRYTYRMEHYIWVREYTKKGFPHFHFVALIPMRGKTRYVINKQEVPFSPSRLSQTWSGYFGSDSKCSIRVGSKPNKYGNRMLYLTNNRRKAWYLSKYIGKSKGPDEIKAGLKLKAFSMDQITSQSIEPQLFKSRYPTETKAVSTWNTQTKRFEDQYFDIATGERVFEDSDGNLFVVDSVSWKYVGHECWTGFPREG